MKGMCIDFQKNQRCPKPVYTEGEAVERADTYKYLGVVFDIKLEREHQCIAWESWDHLE